MSHTRTFALHGDLASPADLRRDMGDPEWVDAYPDWKRGLAPLLLELDVHEWINLVGYSSGGSMISALTWRLDNIRCAVLYEAPNLQPIIPGGNFPVLMIWNDRGRVRWPESIDTYWDWRVNHPVDVFGGRGRHIAFSWRPPFLRHGWDQSLNDRIAAWIQSK